MYVLEISYPAGFDNVNEKYIFPKEVKTRKDAVEWISGFYDSSSNQELRLFKNRKEIKFKTTELIENQKQNEEYVKKLKNALMNGKMFTGEAELKPIASLQRFESNGVRSIMFSEKEE